MHTELKKIQSLESAPKVVKNLFSAEEIGQFLKLYEELPIAVNNLKQKVIKKRWLDGFGKDLELLYKSRIKSIIGDFKMDNLITEDGKECFGLFQESYKPLKLHVDAGFNLEDLIYKQTLVPLSEYGETIIFKNRWYGQSAIFTIDKEELKFKPNDHQNIRSNKHITKDVKFNEKIHKRYLRHIDINNLDGMEIEFIYEWKIGETLIFDRTHLHSASCNIGTKKLSLATFTKK